MITTPEYKAVANYAYHLDAGKFAPFLQKHCTEKLGVRHVLADVVSVNQSESGDIKSVTTRQAGEIAGDLFVDCSGFSSLLLGKTLGVGFKDCSDVLFCDTALAVQVPYETPDAPMASHTISTAQSAGWIWDIGLPTRRGTGYVYSSRHSSEEEARETLLRYIGPRAQGQGGAQDSDSLRPSRDLLEEQLRRRRTGRGISRAARVLRHRADRTVGKADRGADARQPRGHGHRRGALQRREPLPLGPHHRFPQAALRAHATEREPFWRDNLDPQSIPDRLKNLLHLWKYQSPWFFDEFDRLEEVFPAASYQYVLYGMGFRTEVGPMDNADTESTGDAAAARKCSHDQKAAVPAAEESRSAAQDSRAWHAAHLNEVEMTHIVVLNNHAHRTLRVQAEAAAKFGDNQRFVQVVVTEFSLLVTHYPILFSKDAETGAFFCGAMLGIDEGENLFLKEGGAATRVIAR